MNSLERSSAREWVSNEDEACLTGRAERLEWIMSLYPEVEYVAFPGGFLTKQLFEEARYTFVYAQFSSCILISLAFIERCLASLFFSVGRDDLKRAGLSNLVDISLILGIVNQTEYDQLTKMRKARNPIVHFREFGHPETVEIREVGTVLSEDETSLAPDEIIANDAVAAIQLAVHFLARLCVPQSFELFARQARK